MTIFNFEIIFYFIFSTLALTSALFVIYSKNTVYSVFFLIIVFSSITALLLVSEIEFISIMLIIIYVGAITVLFLFVVMMLDINVLKDTNLNFGYIPIIILISFIFFLEIFLVFSKVFTSYHLLIIKFYTKPVYNDFFHPGWGNSIRLYDEWIIKLDNITNIETLGQTLYTYYAFFFVTAGLILLIALIGAVTLTLKEKKNINIKTKNIFQQLSRNSNYAIFKVKKKH